MSGNRARKIGADQAPSRRLQRIGRISNAGGRAVPQPAFLRAEAPTVFVAHAGADHRIRGFRIEKQITFDLCWAAVAVSAGRYRGIANVPAQREMVNAYLNSDLDRCPCSARPGDNGLLLWCVDCAFKMIGVRFATLPGVPQFDALCTMLDAQNPVCVLRKYSTGAHYVVIVGSYRSPDGSTMVTIADPDQGQPDQRDIGYRELFEGDGSVIAAYRF